jgi:hypothetical protein
MVDVRTDANGMAHAMGTIPKPCGLEAATHGLPSRGMSTTLKLERTPPRARLLHGLDGGGYGA